MTSSVRARSRAVTARGRAAPWRRLVVLGDSLASGVGDGVRGRDRSWADRVAAELGSAAYLNLGVSGLVASAVRSTQLEAALRFRPDLAVVCAGGNDALRRSFDPAHVATEMEELVGSLAAQGALVVTFGLFDLSGAALVPPDRRPELGRRLRALNDLTRRTTMRHRGVHVDFFADLARDPSLLSADQIHPNRRGHAHIAATLTRALVARLEQSSAP